MAVSDWSTNPDANAVQPGINLQENQNPKQLNNSIRQVMADLATFYAEFLAQGALDLTDLTTRVEVLEAQMAQIRVYRFGVPIIQTPTADEVVFDHVFTEDVSFASGFPLSRVNVVNRPTTNYTFRIQKNGVDVASLVIFATGSPAYFFSLSGVIVFAEGDVLTLRGANTPQISMERVSVTFKGQLT